jgi:hypothetical protein
MDRPKPKHFAMRDLVVEVDITIEHPEQVDRMIVIAGDFGLIRDKHDHGFSLKIRETFDREEVKSYLNQIFIYTFGE